MTPEQILREAMAFIFSQRDFPPHIRKLAFIALKKAYGDQIPGDTVEESDRLIDGAFDKVWKEMFNEA